MPKLTLTFKGQTLSVHHLPEGSAIIGSDPDCDIVVDSLAVAPRHARVTTEGEDCRISPLDQAFPITVNQAQLENPAVLQHGDIIGVGKHSLVFAANQVSLTLWSGPGDGSLDQTTSAQAAGDEEAPHAAYLQILSGEHIGRIIPLTRNIIRLGKSGGDCAMISLREDGHYLSHLEGRVPTIDGVATGDASVRLTQANVIEIGETRLQFFE